MLLAEQHGDILQPEIVIVEGPDEMDEQDLVIDLRPLVKDL